MQLHTLSLSYLIITVGRSSLRLAVILDGKPFPRTLRTLSASGAIATDLETAGHRFGWFTPRNLVTALYHFRRCSRVD